MLTVNDSNFKNEVISQKGLVVIDFYANWCGPCKAFGPIFEETSKEITDVKFVKVNVDESTISREFKVMSIPTVILFKDGVVTDRFVGVMQKRDLIEFINKNR